MADQTISTPMNNHKTSHLCSTINITLKPLYNLTMNLLTVMGGGLPTDFKRVSGIYFNLFPARFVREEARIIHP